jgi:hypothetical protein
MDEELNADLLASVEQQLVSPQTRYVAETYERLCAAGVPADAAKQAIAELLGELSDRMLDEHEPFDVEGYKAALAGLG